jgi:hypothetical protein
MACPADAPSCCRSAGAPASGRAAAPLPPCRWKTVRDSQRREREERCAANRRVVKAYVLRAPLDRLGRYRTRKGVADVLVGWLEALRWQRPRRIPFARRGI